MKENKYHSYNKGFLCEGCQRCVKGKKLILFITRICSRNCWYCTLGENKYKKDVVYANERPIEKDEEILEEIKDSGADSVGITGGDPLARLERTVRIIKLLKKTFGKGFHIHLYTSLDLVKEEILKELFDSGLDEIRFHLDIEDKKYWSRLSLAKKFSWVVGVEIPLIPEYKERTLELTEFIKDKVDFLNLNELESSDGPYSKVTERGYKSKDEISYAIKGSDELAKEIFEIIPIERVHFCTVKLKDSVQLGERLKLRAKHTAKSFDIITEEGALIRGAIYLEKPSFNYTEELKRKDKEKEIKKLKELKNKLCTELKITRDKLFIDEKKFRFLTSRRIIVKNNEKIKQLGLIPSIVEEYPTYDTFEIEVEFL